MSVDVYLEIGRKRVFASAMDWPGWCRSAADEDEALAALGHYAPRYAAAIGGASACLPPAASGSQTTDDRGGAASPVTAAENAPRFWPIGNPPVPRILHLRTLSGSARPMEIGQGEKDRATSFQHATEECLTTRTIR